MVSALRIPKESVWVYVKLDVFKSSHLMQFWMVPRSYGDGSMYKHLHGTE